MDGSVVDAPADVTAPACDPTKPFKQPIVLSAVSTAQEDSAASLSADELTMYLSSRPPNQQSQIFISTRSDLQSAFTSPVLLGQVNIGDSFSPSVTADGLTMFLISNGTGTVGGHDVFVATRPSTIAAFGAPQDVANVNSTSDVEYAVSVTGSGNDLYFQSARSGTSHIWHAARSGAGYGNPQMVSELADATNGEGGVAVRADGLEIYFSSARAGTLGADDIWVARRASTSDPFGIIRNVTELNSPQLDIPTWVSADGCRILFASSRPGGKGDRDIWFAERPN
jgi:hypothetical protein